MELNFQRIATLVANLSLGVPIEEEHRRIVMVNQQFLNLFGIPAQPEHMVGADCSDSAEQSKMLFLNPQEFVTRIEALLREQHPSLQEYLTLVDGRIFECDYIPIFLLDTYRGHMWAYRDVPARVRQQEMIRHLANHDQLTGLFNRHYLARYTQELVSEPALPLTVAVLDVDHFKSYNDRDGHKYGDAILVAMAHQIQQLLQPGLAFRWGAEEFLVLLPGHSAPQAPVKLHKLRQVLHAITISGAPGPDDDTTISLTFSGGFVEIRGTLTPEELTASIREADAAVYRAKREGRDGINDAVTLATQTGQPSQACTELTLVWIVVS